MSSVERSGRRQAPAFMPGSGKPGGGKIDFLDKIVLLFVDKFILAFPLEVREVLRENGDERKETDLF